MITGKGYIVENYILLTLESRQLSQKNYHSPNLNKNGIIVRITLFIKETL